MNAQIIHDQDHLAARVFGQAIQEADEDLAVERIAVEVPPS